MNSKLSNSMIVVLLLCPLVPGTGRFAYGLYLAIALFFILFFAVTSRFLVLKSGFKETEHYVTLLFVISGAVIFNKVMSFFLPVLAYTLEFYVYLSAFSGLVLFFLFSKETETAFAGGFKGILGNVFFVSIKFFILFLFFGALREIAGYGSLSVPVFSGIRVISLFHVADYPLFKFAASTEGGLVVSAIMICIFRYSYVRYESEKRKVN